MSMRATGRILVLLAVLGTAGARSAAAASCESLATLAPGAATMTAESVVSGGFALPGRGGSAADADRTKSLPAFCRVAATLTPSADSEIKIEVWMPSQGWNGKFLGVGNGGFTGSIAYPAMITALSRGYATASTNTGHDGATAAFAPGHPEKVIDFGHRAVHEMTMAAKRMIAAFYGNAPRYAYWSGCSAGGRQGLKEAQMFPSDYDGIVAGAPATDWTGRASQAMRVWQALRANPASTIPESKYRLLHDAVMKACDALDGVRDGVLENPARCRFDPQTLACPAGSGTAACLTPPQVEAARQVYAAAQNAKTGREISGLMPGSELGWDTWGGERPLSMAQSHFQHLVYPDREWEPRQFDFAADSVRAEEVDAGVINALEPDLRPFFARGGKLIQYHGWSDPQIAPGSSVQYYERVAAVLGGPASLAPSYRLFMVPGMAHCRGGDGTDTFDALGALEAWVEKRVAPASIAASRLRAGKPERTRPLCPYPQTAIYNGTGSTDAAANFRCGIPEP